MADADTGADTSNVVVIDGASKKRKPASTTTTTSNNTSKKQRKTTTATPSSKAQAKPKAKTRPQPPILDLTDSPAVPLRRPPKNFASDGEVVELLDDSPVVTVDWTCYRCVLGTIVSQLHCRFCLGKSALNRNACLVDCTYKIDALSSTKDIGEVGG